MLMIRLQRTGKRNQPHYRVVLTDKRNAPKSGRFLELLGSHDPRLKNTQLNEERIKHWVGVGAQPSDTVHNMLVKANIIDAPKRKVRIPTKMKEEEKKEEKQEDKPKE